MICRGFLTLGSVVRFERTADNTPQLLLQAYAPGLNANGVAYKLVWTGWAAENFYLVNEHRLHLGADLDVMATNPQPLLQDGQSYILALVVGIEIVRRAEYLAAKAGAHYTPRPLVKSRWVALDGVEA